MLRQRHQHRILMAAFLFALVGVAFFAGYTGLRLQDSLVDHPAQPPSETGGGDQHQREGPWEKWTDPLAVFTFLLALGTFLMARGVYRQVGLARNEFNATHRPALRLKHIWISSVDGQQYLGRLQSSAPLTVRLDVVNIGNTKAVVNTINFVTLLLPPGTRLPQRPPYNQPGVPQFTTGGGILESGITLTTHVSDGRVISHAELQAIWNANTILYCVGTIEYLDSSGRVRHTAFCRYLKFQTNPHQSADHGRFEREDDPDYEYQD